MGIQAPIQLTGKLTPIQSLVGKISACQTLTGTLSKIEILKEPYYEVENSSCGITIFIGGT